MKKSLSYPYLIWMAIFVVVPILIVCYFAFTTKSGAFTLDNILQVANYSDTLLKSILLGGIATVICLLLGYPVGLILSRSREHVQRTMLLLVMLPMWMNFLLRTYSWMTILGDNGIINNIFRFFGLPTAHLINNSGAVVLGMVYNFLPFMIMPIYSVMVKIDRRVIEAAQDLGANYFRVLTKVILPLSLPGIISGITMVFVPAVSTFVISKMLGGGEMLIGDIIELQIIGGSNNLNLGAAMSLVLMVLVLLTMAVMRLFDDGEDKAVMF